MENSSDEEHGQAPIEYLNGFSTFAAYITSDSELAIYRKFDFLSARNLLYLQSELIALEAELKEFDAHDLKEEKKENMNVMLSSRCWEIFEKRARDSNRAESERMRVILRIRVLMKEYREYHIVLYRRCMVANQEARLTEYLR